MVDGTSVDDIVDNDQELEKKGSELVREPITRMMFLLILFSVGITLS